MYQSSVLVHSLLLPLQASDSRALGLLVPGGVSPRLGEVNNRERKKKKRKKEENSRLWRNEFMKPYHLKYNDILDKNYETDASGNKTAIFNHINNRHWKKVNVIFFKTINSVKLIKLN